MKQDIKERWVAALRSGEYEQGYGSLRKDGEDVEKPIYCCLGVLTDLYVKEHKLWWEKVDDGRYKFADYVAFPAPCVQRWAGFVVPDPILPPEAESASLAVANDRERKTFAEIADLIEKYL